MIRTSELAINRAARRPKFTTAASTIVGAIFLTAAVAFAQQQQQQPPWSEQMPAPQRPGPYNGPGPGGPGPNAGLTGGSINDQGDAPDRGVARISLMNGNVSVRRGDSGDLVAAIVNAPLTAGDRVVTAGDGRAEVELDSAHLFRVSPSSEVRLSELEYHRYQIQVATGTTIFRVVKPTDAQVEISTPSVAVRPLQPGVYRVSVLPDGTSEITVRLGDAEVFSPRGSEPLHVGKTMQARGAASDPEFQMIDPVPQDDFEHWCIQRDQQLARAEDPRQSPSARYVNPNVTGTEDLDANGRWVNDPSYGNVWVPQVDPGWAPYSCGRWVWLDFYGWTWEGCESWGWAPYHYGRWFYGGYGWAWWPGPLVGPYYWRPALVGFFGWGAPGFGVGIGFGFGFANIGWVPLAPFELFHPWYGRAFYGAGFGGVRVVNNVNVVSAFRNARFSNAVSSVRAGDFGRGAIGSANMVRAPASELARAGMVHGQLPVAPTRESTQFSSRAASTQGLPASRTTSFASHMPTSSASRIPFEQQRATMASRGASPVRINPSLVQNRGSSAGGASNGASNSNGGWRSFDPSSRGGASGAGSSQPNRGGTGAAGSNGATNNGGWRGYEPGNRGSATGSQGQPQSQSGSRGGYPQSGTYSQPRSSQSGGYSAPRSAPSGSYSAPRSAPPSSGGSGNSRPSGGGSRGGGGSRSGGGRH